MFVFTLGKKGAKRLGAMAVAGMALAGAVFAAGSFFREDAAATGAQPENTQQVNPAEMRIENTQGLDEFFKAFGMEADLADAEVDKVKIPRKWDESFAAFNTVIKESSMDLEKYKGKTVEKWTVHCPARSTGEQKVYGVVLVYKQQPVGAYLLEKPSGEVTGLVPVQSTAAALTEEEAEAAAAEFGSQMEVVETAAAPEAVQTTGQYEEDEQAMAAAEAAALAELEAQIAQAGAEPVD